MPEIFCRRTFLNRRSHHRGAYVLAHIADDPRYGTISAQLTIADCDRVVHLDLDVNEPRDVSNALFKASLLRRVVCDFVDAFERAVESRDVGTERRS